MRIDVEGRVKNTMLAASKPLLPLYEAIVNSVQAIEDVNAKSGKIQIVIVRDTDHLLSKQDATAGEIIGFDVIDNGIGFTDDNFQAFCTADTTYKAGRGGKGVGRFLWLVAFTMVQVESHFKRDKKMVCRSFDFVAEDDGIRKEASGQSIAKSRRTVVRLRGFKKKFQEQCPRKLETIASHIIEHCLEFLIRPDCPQIVLEDEASGDTLLLNDRLEHELADKGKVDRIEVDGNPLDVLHVRLFESHGRDHTVYFCANHRVVKTERLLGKVPNLARHLSDDAGHSFVYAAYVDGELLNDSANSERTGFTIFEDDSELLVKRPTWPTIRQKVVASAQTFLAPYTEPVRQRKRKRIQDYVAQDGPMYRPILKHIESDIDMIDPDISDDALDLRLYEAYHGLQVKLRSEGQEILNEETVADEDYEEFSKRFEEYFDKVSDINQADLARYVCHRKAILNFLEKQLSLQSDGKYSREDRVHSIIFPMGKTSDDVPFDAHNLWLVDEKLVFHRFLASDRQLRTGTQIACDSRKEPDLIVFDKACAFAASAESPIAAIDIIEFKRPMLAGHTEDDNPVTQVLGYVQDIQDGKARTPEGRDIPIGMDIPFFCYIVCDITPSLVKQAKLLDLTATPDRQGFFGYRKQYNAYVEIISYTKLVGDAKKRNAAFFNKLGLPDRPTTT